jgi:membrane protease YdiL (CAAX protease family)
MTAGAEGTLPARDRTDLDDLVLWLGVLVVAGMVGATLPLVGAAVDGLVIVLLALFARSNTRWADAAAALALVPVLRLLWLAMPVDGIAPLDWVPLVAPPLLVAAVLVGRAAGLSGREIGLRMPIWVALSALTVAGWAAAGYVLSVVAGDAVAWGATRGGIAWDRVLVYALLIAIAEELTFRGVLPAVLERLVPRDGMWVATVACATLSLGTALPWWAGIGLAIAGVNGALAARTRSLVPLIVGHALFLVALNL